MEPALRTFPTLEQNGEDKMVISDMYTHQTSVSWYFWWAYQCGKLTCSLLVRHTPSPSVLGSTSTR